MLGFIDSKVGKRVYPLVLCMIPLFMAFYCCIIKSGGFVDEYFSLSFSNCINGGYLLDSFDGYITHKVITPNQLISFISVAQEERFVYDFVIRNCSSDLTPPLYYFILHTICSFFPGMVSKWFGLSINLVAYFVILLFLYYSSYLIYKSRWVSTLVTLCYGFSMGGLNCATYIRMYAMVTMWSILLLFFILQVLQRDRWYHFIAVGIVIYLGFLTQYNFGILAFFLCATTCSVLLYRKKMKKMLLFGSSALSGVLLFFLTWPSLFSQSEKVVSWTGDNGKDSVGVVMAIQFWCRMFFKQYKVQVIMLLFMGVSIIILTTTAKKYIHFSDAKSRLLTKDIGDAYVIVLLSFILGTVGIAYFAPYFSPRYCFNVMPLWALLLGLVFMLFRWCLSKFFDVKKIRFNMNIVGVLLAVFIILGALDFEGMAFLYLDNPEKLKVTESVSSYPCIFINTNHDKSIIDTTDHLIKFKDIYVTDYLTEEEYNSYMSNYPDADAVVVFVDTDPFGSSGLDSDEVMWDIYNKGWYDSVYELYELESVKAFLLCNSDASE